MEYDYVEQLAKVTGTIGTTPAAAAITAAAPMSGLSIANAVTVTTTGPLLTTMTSREFVLLISKVPDIAADGSNPVVINDGTNTYLFVDDRGYLVHADRLNAKARFIGADAILPVRCVFASDLQRVVALSFLPATAVGNDNTGPTTSTAAASSSSSTTTGSGTTA